MSQSSLRGILLQIDVGLLVVNMDFIATDSQFYQRHGRVFQSCVSLSLGLKFEAN